MTAIDLKKYIYENDKIEYVLEQIGCHSIVFHPNKNYYSCSNAKGGDCNNKAAINIKCSPYLNYINYTRGVSSDDQEDLISLVQYNMDLDFVGAMKYLHKILGLQYKFEKKKEEEKQKEDPLAIFKKYSSKKHRCNVMDFEPMDEEVLNDFVPYIHIDLFKEGIMPNTIKKFELGYSYRWKRTIFPIRYWATGELMGYNSRTSIDNYDEFGIVKYFITPGLKKEINLYGLWENYKSIQKLKYVTLFEAEKSVVKRDSRFDESCVALQGHSLSEEQCRIILGLNVKEVIIAMDKDVPLVEIYHMCEKFYRLRKVSFIYDKWGILGEKDSPADADNKMYDFLFKYRVAYDEKLHKEYLKRLEKR